MQIILASQSPRRKELLTLMGLRFETMPSTKEEDMTKHMSLTKLAESLAEQKAVDVFAQTSGDRVVIGSDTMVAFKNKLFGKPRSKLEAKSMLQTLSNRWHKVITSLCVIVQKNGQTKKYLTHDICKVKFLKLSNADIDNYLLSNEYADKAGAYAIQGQSGMFVQKIRGSYATVVGLPTHLLFQLLKAENLM